MTFDEFKANFRIFLENSTVNLGRKTTKTRQVFIKEAMAKIDAFGENFLVAELCSTDKDKQSASNSMDDRIICIKPKDSNKALDVGKGVHAMSPTESMRADEQLNRSPYGNKSNKKE
jgi:hypothetical protein